MATYKVIQDIEAEDKFIGPLTLKQFIFGAVAAVFLYLSAIAVTKNATWLLAVFLPPALLGAFLAIPWSKDQSTEVWALAKLRFYLKPRKRLWDQSGVKELVTITVPKKIERQLTDNLSQNEVRSRLTALAETIDSRGWAIKNSSATSAAIEMNFSNLSDRLVSPSILPQPVPDFDVNQVHDVMEPTGNSLAANFDQMLQTSSEVRRDQSLEKMERIRRGESLESLQQPEPPFVPPVYSAPEPPAAVTSVKPIVPPPYLPPALDEEELSRQLQAQKHIGDEVYERLHVVPTSGSTLPPKTSGTHESKTVPAQSSSTMTTPASPGILNLAHNDDLSVETIARQARKMKGQNDGSEVVISLH